MTKRKGWGEFVGKDVGISWRADGYDWPYFRVVSADGDKAILHGIDCPDGSVKHVGDSFSARWDEVKTIRLIEKNIKAQDDSYYALMGDSGVLSRAREIVDGRDKQQHYGPPEESMSRIASVWSGILGVQISAGQVALMMAGLKLARLGVDPEHADSLDDLAGYARIYERVK